MIFTKTQAVILAVVMCCIMLDFVSGIIAALATGTWKSELMRKGLLHKCSLILCIALGALLNFGQAYLDLGISIPAYEAICAYIVIMEAGSCLENLGKANPELLPDKIRKLFGLPDGDDNDGSDE